MINLISDIIQQNETFLILPHRSPDGDTLGSAVALKKMLMNLGKVGYIIIDDDIPDNLKFITDGEEISYEELKSGKIEAEHIFCLDGSSPDMFEERAKLLENHFVINIDHHITNVEYGDINYIQKASSVGEILFDLFERLNYPMTEEVCEAIYVAISTDTGSFKYTNTSAKTFRIASKIREMGIAFEKINIELYQNISLEKILLDTEVMKSLRIYEKNIGVIVLTDEIVEKLALNEINTDGLVEKVRNISSIDIAVFLKQMDNEFFKVSMRSKGSYDVSKLASKYGGGGHKKAAGFAIQKPLAEAVELIVKEINH